MAQPGKHPLHVQLKAAALVARYYLGAYIRRGLDSLSLLLFVLSLAMFLIIAVPNLLHRIRESPILAMTPRTMRMTGTVTEEVADPGSGNIDERPLANVTLETGGFRTITDAEGRYDFEFRTVETVSVPIVIHHGQDDLVFRVDFPPGQFVVRIDFVVK